MILLPIFALKNEVDRIFIEKLYTKHKYLMFKIARNIVVDRSLAEDMVSEACIIMIKHIDTLRSMEERSQRAYIISISRSVSIDYVVKQNRQKRRALLTEGSEKFDFTVQAPEVEERILREVEIEELLEAIMRIPERERVVLRMKYFDLATDDEIAKKLKIKPASVRMYLTKARRCLRNTILNE